MTYTSVCQINFRLIQFISPSAAGSYTRLHEGDVIFAASGETLDEIGKAAAYCDSAVAYGGSDTIIFRPGPRVDGRFLGYAVNHEPANRYKSRMGQGSTVMHIGTAALSRMPIALPPLPQQQRIAEILDTLDEAIRKTEEVIAKLQQVKQGLLHDLLTRGIDEHGELRDPDRHPEQFKDSELGRVPRDWKVGSLRRQITLQRGFDITVDSQRPGDVPVVSSSGISSYHDVAMVHVPGVVTGRKGKLGNAYYIDRPFWPHDTTLWVKNFHGNDARFVALFLDNFGLERLDAATSVPTLNRNTVHPIVIAFPKVNEQLELVRASDTFDARASTEQATLEKLRELRSGLAADLLTGRVRTTP